MSVTQHSITQASTTSAKNKTMGVSSSRPEKPKGKTNQRTKLRNSVALRQRISLNKLTLDRLLKQIGHPVREHSRESAVIPGLEQALRTLSTHAFAMALQGGDANDREHNVVGLHHQVDKDKPLPSWPPLITTKKLEEQLTPLWPPLVTARRLEQQLERSYIQRQREETLRLLESGPEPHQASRSRVPNIIQRRIRRAAVVKDSSGLGTTRC